MAAPLHALAAAARRLGHHRAATLTSAASLAVALAVAVLVLQTAVHELSFDRFHADADRLRRVVLADPAAATVSARTPAALGPALADALPGVDAAVRVRPAGGEVLLEGARDGRPARAYRDDVLYADGPFFEAFSFPAVAGSAAAFGPAGTAVLTAPAARELFGADDAVGRAVRVDGGAPVEVVAVVAEPPARSSLPFGAVVSLATFEAARAASGMVVPGGWDEYAYVTYARLTAPDAAPDASALEAVVTARAGGAAVTERAVVLEPLTDARHVSAAADGVAPPGPTGPLVALVGVALLLLGVASATTANLAVARGLREAPAVGTRLALGATPADVARAYLADAFVLSAGSLLLGAALARLALPAYRAALDLPLELRYDRPAVWLGLAALVAVTTALAGAYPAWTLPRLSPDAALRGRTELAGAVLRRGLVTFQLATTVFLLACAAVLALQVRHVRAAPTGFEGGPAVAVPLRQSEARQAPELLRRRLEASPHVATVSLATAAPTLAGAAQNTIAAPGESDLSDVTAHLVGADPAYAEALGLTLVEGRFLTAADSGRAAVINEAAARALGWADPVGRRIEYWGSRARTVVGVVGDFRVEGPRAPVAPLVVVPREELWTSVAVVRLHDAPAGPAADGPAALAAAWAELYPDDPYGAVPLADAYAALSADEARLAGAFGGFALVAVLVACLGLASLVAFAAERRRREIGVRIALGATDGDVARLLGAEFAPLLAAGVAVALPAAVWAGRYWVEGFATRADLGALPFIAAAAGTAALAGATVFWRGYQAARRTPAASLRAD